MAKFKAEVIEQIRQDPKLFGDIATLLGILPSSLPETLKRNGNKLNQYSVVKLVADHMGKNPDELVEEPEMEPQS